MCWMGSDAVLEGIELLSEIPALGCDLDCSEDCSVDCDVRVSVVLKAIKINSAQGIRPSKNPQRLRCCRVLGDKVQRLAAVRNHDRELCVRVFVNDVFKPEQRFGFPYVFRGFDFGKTRARNFNQPDLTLFDFGHGVLCEEVELTLGAREDVAYYAKKSSGQDN